MNKQALLFYPLLGVVLLVLFVGGLAYGAVPIPLDHVMDILLGKGSDKIAWQNIVLQSRLPQAITALLAGASLATSGLLLQTLFRNPLAGPSILGISDGANLGVAAIMLYFGGTLAGQRIYGGDSCCVRRGLRDLGIDYLFLREGEEQCHALDYRYNDRLSGLVGYLYTELLFLDR